MERAGEKIDVFQASHPVEAYFSFLANFFYP